MNWEERLHRWNADLYDQEETQTDDVDLLRSWVGAQSQRILEVACGSGRILLPLARDGHRLTGIDRDSLMVARLFAKADDTIGFTVTLDDATACDWGQGYDVVVLGGNILMNIVSDGDQMEDQRLFLLKAFGALQPGGHLFLDGDARLRPDKAHSDTGERVIFQGTDSHGVSGRFSLTDEAYDPDGKILSGTRRWALTAPDGERWEKAQPFRKVWATVPDIDGWLADAGFAVERRWAGYEGRPIDEGTWRAAYWAQKPQSN